MAFDDDDLEDDVYGANKDRPKVKDFDFGFDSKEFRPAGDDFDFSINSGLQRHLFEMFSPRNYDSGLVEELSKNSDPTKYDSAIRWSYLGDEDAAKLYHDLARKSLFRSFLAHKDGTHLGYGKRRYSYRKPVRVTEINEDGDVQRVYEEEVDDALQIETVFSPDATEINIWASPPITRIRRAGEEEGECEGEGYFWVGMRMSGSQESKAAMYVWEPWPETKHFHGPDDDALQSYTGYYNQLDDDGNRICPVTSSPAYNYTGWYRRFVHQRALGRKTGDDYIEGYSPPTNEQVFTNFMFDTGICDDYEEIWDDSSRPGLMWHGLAPTISWQGTVVASRYGAYFCGPGRAHDPEDSDECWFESFHLDPEDPVKHFPYMHKYPDSVMGWGYHENNVGPPLWEDFPQDMKWNVKGTVLPGKYIVKLAVERSKCAEGGALNVEISIKLGKGIKRVEGKILSKCLQASQSEQVIAPRGMYVYRTWMPHGLTRYDNPYWDGTPQEDLRYPNDLNYGPVTHSDESWWQGHIAVDVENRVIDVIPSTPPDLLEEMGFMTNATPPPYDPYCCVNGIDPPVSDENVTPFPPSHDPLDHQYFLGFRATVISTTTEGHICLIQVTSQAANGGDPYPPGYGMTFQADGWDDGEDYEYAYGMILPPMGTSYSPGDAVIIVLTSLVGPDKYVRHVGDSWFDNN